MGDSRFATLLSLALLSVVVENARFTVLVWELGNPTLPASLLLISQIAIVIGGTAGALVAPVLASRLGVARLMVAAFVLQAAYATLIGVISLNDGDGLTEPVALTLALLGHMFGIVGALIGVVWLPMINDWPIVPDNKARSRLQLDSAQYQLGKVIGPLVGSVAISSLAAPLAVASFVNAGTYMLVGVYAAFCVSQGHGTQIVRNDGVVARRGWPTVGLPSRATRIWLAILVFSIAVDSVRLYLPRLLRVSGGDPSLFGVVQASMALTAVIAAVIWSHAKGRSEVLMSIGAVAGASALALWAAFNATAVAWVVGAILLGIGVSAFYPSANTMLMSSASSAQARMRAASYSVLARQWSGAAGGAGLSALMLFPVGPWLPLGIAAAVAAAGSVMVPLRPADDIEQLAE